MYLILALILIGMIAGWVAEKVIYPDWKMDWTEAFIVGIVGSLLFGVTANLIAGDGFELRPAGIIGSVIGAIVVLAIVKWFRGRVVAQAKKHSE
jgi:uncharacterized membrane protein YeaQ/YmgE (transglycosylase-associated protein family)